jgi:hypothetical protein
MSISGCRSAPSAAACRPLCWCSPGFVTRTAYGHFVISRQEPVKVLVEGVSTSSTAGLSTLVGAGLSGMSDKHLLAGGFGFPLGFVAATVVVLGSAAVGAFAHPVAVLVALAVATAAVSATTTLPAALGTALISWGLYTGFVVGHFGDLSVNVRTVVAAGVLALAALVAVGVMALRRLFRESRVRAVMTPVRVVRLVPPVRG